MPPVSGNEVSRSSAGLAGPASAKVSSGQDPNQVADQMAYIQARRLDRYLAGA